MVSSPMRWTECGAATCADTVIHRTAPEGVRRARVPAYRLRVPRHFAALAIAAVLVLAAQPAGLAMAVPIAPTADVHGDDEQDRYVGTGGLLLPASVDSGTRRTVAACADCAWRLTSPCVLSPLGHAFDGQSPCLSVVRGCAAGDQLLRGWFHGGGEPWGEIGLVCIATSGPLTVSEVGRAARDRFEQDLPALAPTAQPGVGIVAQVPVVFGAGQVAGTTRRSYRVLDADVELTATPRWGWKFGDGASLRTADPGGRYPVIGVTHPYRRAGDYSVEITATWSAAFTVDGLGPFPVAEPVTQLGHLPVRVGEGRALLTP